LLDSYPDLVEKNDYKINYKINFFNRTNTVGEMLKLAEGASGMKYIQLGYERNMKRYKCEGKKHPVIMLADNDQAGIDLVKSIQNKEQNKAPDYYHVSDNLYIMMIPKVKEKHTEIEDYFDEETLKKELNGKIFHREKNTFDTKIHYGKSVFSREVIIRNQHSINFEKFKDILNPIVSIIQSYKT